MVKILPLEGFKVVELSNMVTASLATMTLAQQGADVVKVEPLGIGDKMRHLGSQKNGISGVFNNCNRGKKSVAINLKHARGQEVVRKLILSADILVHNYRPGIMTKLGLGSADVRAQNPSLIVCSLTGFGRAGPLKNAPAFDHVIQALAGLTSVQGKEDDFEFMRMLVCDKITAYTAAQAVTSALVHRLRTGEGQHIDISMLAASLAFMWPDGMMHKTLLADDVVPLAPISEYYQTFKTSDGYIAAAPFGNEDWQFIFEIVNRPDLAANPKFNTLPGRAQNITELLVEFETTRFEMTNSEALRALLDADVACAPCHSLDQLAAHDQIKAIKAVETQIHPHLGEVQMAAAPVLFGSQAQTPLGPSPLLGEHTEAVLSEFGDKDTIAHLRKVGVI